MTTLSLILIVVSIGPALILSARMYSWWTDQHSKKLEAQPIKASDLISLISLTLTIVSLIIGWYSISRQIKRGALDIKIKNTADDNGALQAQLSAQRSEQYQAAVNDTDIHVESPVGNVRYVGAELPELRWKYAKHSSATDYIVELLYLPEPGSHPPANFRLLKTSECEDGVTHCRFRASSASGQLSMLQAPILDANHEGRYLWRVAPVSAGFTGNDYPELHWSEYGSFCFYKDAPVSGTCLAVPVPASDSRRPENERNRILVGTNLSENVDFSSVINGSRHGFDIDLTRLLLEGCIRKGKDGFRFSSKQCESAVRLYTDPSTCSDLKVPEGSLEAVFANYGTIDEGLKAVRYGHVDLFIGALTKAKDRDVLPVRLTQGYYPFSSALYSLTSNRDHRNDGYLDRLLSVLLREPGRSEFQKWKKSKQNVGVIDGSTNQWLAEDLIEVENLQDSVTVEAFSSFASLKESLEQGRIQSVIVDNTLGKQLRDVTEIKLPRGVWRTYHAQLGEDTESFAIAVADEPQDADATQTHSGEINASLYSAIRQALDSKQIKSVTQTIECRNLRYACPCTSR